MATKNRLIGYARSLVVENNAGHDVFPAMMFGNTTERGPARVDLDERADGRAVWESSEISQTTVPKLSLGPDGTAYLASIRGLLAVRDR